MIASKRNKKAKPTFEMAQFDSIGAMASITGIPEDILKNAKRSGCNFIRHGRCDLPVFLRWYFSRDVDGEEAENWTKRDKRAGALMKEHKLEKARGSVIDNATHQAMLSDIVSSVFFGELDRLAQEFPATLKAKTESEINQEVESQIEIIRLLLKRKVDEWEKKLTAQADE